MPTTLSSHSASRQRRWSSCWLVVGLFVALTTAVPPRANQLASFSLFNAATGDMVLSGLGSNGSEHVTVDLQVIGRGRRVNLVAESVAKIGSVKFFLEGRRFKTQSRAPYALAGKRVVGDSVKYRSWRPCRRVPKPCKQTYTIKAVPHRGRNGRGRTGQPLQILITFIDTDHLASVLPKSPVITNQPTTRTTPSTTVAQPVVISAPPPPPPPSIRLACLGDSLTAASSLTMWPEHLRHTLGSGFSVRAFARSGSTYLTIPASIRPFIHQPEFQQALFFQPQIVIILLGMTN